MSDGDDKLKKRQIFPRTPEQQEFIDHAYTLYGHVALKGLHGQGSGLSLQNGASLFISNVSFIPTASSRFFFLYYLVPNHYCALNAFEIVNN
jgi:hypothetical protein